MKRDDRIPVCIFAKPPVPGQVKRRLSKSMGLEAGASLAHAFLKDSWEALSRVNWVRPILVTTERHASLGEFLQNAEIWLQGEGTLGERLERILSRALEVSDIALAVGGDTPGLPPRLLEQARAALQTADAVLGPADDGGFYLLGLRRCPRGLLQDIEWSSEDTHRQTRARLEKHELRPAEIERWFDIDVPEDLWRFHRLLKAGQVEAPATAKLLQQNLLISVIIPVLNEGARIRRHLEKVCALRGLHEIIVVDGGSTDDTAFEARAFPRVRWLSAPRGRALQQNAAARMAEGNVFLFLHADVELPEDAAARIETALESDDVVAGAFRTWTVSDSNRRWPGPLLHLADLRSRYTGLPYGDQALFVRAEAFHRAGGFPEQPLMEDLELSRRLSRIGRIVTAPARVLVSGRRFEAGILYYALAINLFPFLYRMGVSPRILARLYRHVR